MHFLHWSIVKQRSQSKRLEFGYLAFGWGIPFILSSIPLALGSYGKAYGWCWIEGTTSIESIVLQITEGFGMILIVIIYNIFTLLQIKATLSHGISDSTIGECLKKKLMKRLVYYPMVLIICIIPAAVHRIILSTGKENNTYVAILAADFQCLLGFGNCVVYGFTDNLKKKLKKKFNILIDNPELSTFSIK